MRMPCPGPLGRWTATQGATRGDLRLLLRAGRPTAQAREHTAGLDGQEYGQALLPPPPLPPAALGPPRQPACSPALA
jgi:hypothetical protein